MPKLSDLKVQLFTDGADKAQILDMAKQPWIRGFTTNPSLLKKAGVSDYAAYGRDLVTAVPDRHISFEVFSDDIPEMIAQADVITTWGANVYVKLPVTTTRGEPLFDAVRSLSRKGVKINMTAIFSATRSCVRSTRLPAAHPLVCRYLPAVWPILASTIGRSCGTPWRAHARPRMWRSSGPPRVKSLTSLRLTRWAATSSPRRRISSRSCPRSERKAAPELSLSAVKAFRDDAIAAGLKLAVGGQESSSGRAKTIA